MLWVLWDIVLPLITTFLAGLLTGWLLWRWRRSRIDADGLSKLRRSSARNKADVERLQQSNIELSDRLQAASGSGGGELASARKRIDLLTEELKASRHEVAELGRNGSPSDSNLHAELKRARSRITELEDSALENTAVSSSSSFNTSASESETADLREEIAARDRMIATLEKSLEQFGESGDNTALMADIAIRDRKINELEEVVSSLKRD